MIKKIFTKLKNEYSRFKLIKQYDSIYNLVKNYTMIDPALFYDNLKLIDGVKNVQGDIIECGVWKGGMSAGMAYRCEQNRHFYLFDSFEGLPPAKILDGPEAVEYQKGNIIKEKFFNNLIIDECYANEIMSKTGKPYTLIKGWFEQTMPSFEGTNEIALLRMDADWYESTMTTLECLYPKVVKGGLVVIDDYHAWDGCSRAVHDYLSSIKSVSRINRTPNGVAYWIKRD